MAKKPNAKKARPKPRGRPVKKVDYERVKSLAGRGLTKEQIARCLGICPKTFFNRQGNDEKFAAAIQEGEANAIAAVTAELFKNIKLGNMTGIIFFLKCRAGWKETTIVENRDLPPIPGSDCPPDEAEAAYIASMQGIK